MFNTADGPGAKDSGNDAANANVDADFGASGKGVEAMGNGLGGRGGEGFGGCGVSTEGC